MKGKKWRIITLLLIISITTLTILKINDKTPQYNPPITLEFSTLLGGDGTESIRDVATDNLKNIIAVGKTESTTGLTNLIPGNVYNGGTSDGLIAKYSSNYNLLWIRYFGGPNHDRIYATETDIRNNDIIIAGRAGRNLEIKDRSGRTGRNAQVIQNTFAGDTNPVSAYGEQDGFVAKFDQNGNLKWSTYLGHSGYDIIRDVDVDNQGNIYVILIGVKQPVNPAYTFSGPPHGGDIDINIIKIDENGENVLEGRLYGGIGDDSGGAALRVNKINQEVYIAGSTTSTDLPIQNGFDPTHNGNWDFFIARFSPDLSNLIYSSYFGGSNNEIAETHGIAINNNEEAYIVGITTSNDLEIKDYQGNRGTNAQVAQNTFGGAQINNGYGMNTNYDGDGFIAKINTNPTNGGLIASSYIGGTNGDGAEGISLDNRGNPYVSGATYTPPTAIKPFPITSNAHQPTMSGRPGNGNAESIITMLDARLTQFAYSSYHGGSDTDTGRIAHYSNDALYIGGITRSTDYPTTTNAPQQNLKGTSDAHIEKISFTPAGGGGGGGGVSITSEDAQTIPNKEQWQNLQQITFGQINSKTPSADSDSQENIHITWSNDLNGNYEIYYQKLNNKGNPIISQTRMTTTPNPSTQPQIKIDDQDNIHLIWVEEQSANRKEIHHQKLNNNGQLINQMTPITNGNSISTNPKFEIDRRGTLSITWDDTRDGNKEIYYEKRDRNGAIIINDLRITNENSASQNPSITTDTNGNAIIAWEEDRTGALEIFYTKINLNNQIIIPPTRITNTITQQTPSYNPTIQTDSQNNIYIVWTDLRSRILELYLHKLNPTGQTLIDNQALTNGQFAINPTTSISSDDKLNIIWTDLSTRKLIPHYMQLSPNGATRIPNQILTTELTEIQNNAITTDNNNKPHLILQNNQNNQGTLYHTYKL
jgi:hypothetical protein